jgi:hypothetical protein
MHQLERTRAEWIGLIDRFCELRRLTVPEEAAAERVAALRATALRIRRSGSALSKPRFFAASRRRMKMTDDAVTKIRLAVEEFDHRVAFLWKYADAPLDEFAYKPDDPSPAKLAQHYQEMSNFAAWFADEFEGARRKLVEAVKPAFDRAAPPNTERWQSCSATFDRFDRDTTAFWKALEIVLSHYDAHPPDDQAELARHYEEKTLFSFEFIRQLRRERKDFDQQMELFGAETALMGAEEAFWAARGAVQMELDLGPKAAQMSDQEGLREAGVRESVRGTPSPSSAEVRAALPGPPRLGRAARASDLTVVRTPDRE